jgi:hypothetical protein
VAILGFRKPPQPRVLFSGRIEQELTIVASMGQMPDKPRKKMTLGSRHEELDAGEGRKFLSEHRILFSLEKSEAELFDNKGNTLARPQG